MKNMQQTQMSPKERFAKLNSSIYQKENGIVRKFSSSSNWKWGDTYLKYMDTNHIRSCIKQLQNKPKDKINGHSSKEWLDAFKIELNHRNELADCFMFIKFPKFQQKFKQAVKIAIQEPNY
jgi:hypothetical protein